MTTTLTEPTPSKTDKGDDLVHFVCRLDDSKAFCGSEVGGAEVALFCPESEECVVCVNIFEAQGCPTCKTSHR